MEQATNQPAGQVAGEAGPPPGQWARWRCSVPTCQYRWEQIRPGDRVVMCPKCGLGRAILLGGLQDPWPPAPGDNTAPAQPPASEAGPPPPDWIDMAPGTAGHPCRYRCFSKRCGHVWIQIRNPDLIVMCPKCGDGPAVMLGLADEAGEADPPWQTLETGPARMTFWDAILADPEIDPADKRMWMLQCYDHVSALLRRFPPETDPHFAIALAGYVANVAGGTPQIGDPVAIRMGNTLIGAAVGFLWDLVPPAGKDADGDFLDLLTHSAAVVAGSRCPNCGWEPPPPPKPKRGRPRRAPDVPPPPSPATFHGEAAPFA